MPSLMDIAPSHKTVETSFGQVSVPGITIFGIVAIIQQHPELVEVFKNEGFEFDYSKVLNMGLDVAASFLAAGLGYPGNKEAEKRCKELNPEDAFDLGQAILQVSLPKGPKSFFDKVTLAMNESKLLSQVKVTNSQNS